MKNLFILSILALSACAPPAVVESKGNSVTVQSSFSKVDPVSADDAHRICAKRGAYAKYASSREVQTPNYLPNKYHHLFRCIPGRRKAPGGYLNSSSSL